MTKKQVVILISKMAAMIYTANGETTAAEAVEQAAEIYNEAKKLKLSYKK